jgi:hypothetical protein
MPARYLPRRYDLLELCARLALTCEPADASPGANLSLSSRRAMAVLSWLLRKDTLYVLNPWVLCVSSALPTSLEPPLLKPLNFLSWGFLGHEVVKKHGMAGRRSRIS